MVRLTRAQGQARTRSLLVKHATRLFLEHGFAATSLNAIGEAAGFSRGAVYSNFDSKAEIGLAVLDDLYAGVASRAADVGLAALGEGPGALLAGVATSLEPVLGSSQLVRFELEIAAACTDEQLKTSFGRRYAFLRDALEHGLAAAGAAEPARLAHLALSALLGAAIQRAADDDRPFDEIVLAISHLADIRRSQD